LYFTLYRITKFFCFSWYKLINFNFYIEYQIKTSDNPRLWFEIHLTGLLGNQEINNFENKQESKNNARRSMKVEKTLQVLIKKIFLMKFKNQVSKKS